ncbi:VWA domain-containing protein [Nitrosomonas oligotropha]|uniref:VWA domain-containing protein n=1 Tax=Nitrosomonas oligotropha TaxID=42354 RepID=UPI0023DB290D|nr:VWA domain-containing protein [Nitrosomonas oligotropha]
MTKIIRQWLVVSAVASIGLGVSSTSIAAVAVSWTGPSPLATYSVGEIVNPFGNANASGIIGGTGLDLALVLDSSGSMSTINSGKSRNAWLEEASAALVNALPVDSTSVAVIDFDSSASLLQGLTPLSSGSASVLSAITAIDASGGTAIDAGIDRASTELTGSNHIDGRTQMMVVVSDGESNRAAAVASATAALGLGVDAIHTVGIPGHNVLTMQSIATAGNGIYTNASDLTSLVDLFNGTAGNLVGIDYVDVTMNDGSFISHIAIDGLGNFVLPDATLFFGANVFTAVAYDTLGNSATAELILTAVPEPSTYAMLGLGLVLVGCAYRRRIA